MTSFREELSKLSHHQNTQTKEKESETGRLLFQLRFMAAMALMLLLILSDQKKLPFLGRETKEVFAILETDYYEQVEEYVKAVLSRRTQ